MELSNCKVVEMYTNSLCPGMMLEGDAYDERDCKILKRDLPITYEQIEKLKIDGIKKIHYTKRRKSQKGGDNPAIRDDCFFEAQNVLSKIQESAHANKSYRYADDVNKVINSFIEDIQEKKEKVINLFDISSLDEYTYTHSINVAALSIMLALFMKLEEEEVKMAGIAGLLMDIGMTLVPKEVLSKRNVLTENEWKIVKQHPIFSYNILKSEEEINIEILNAILFHHEWYNGNGYPFGISRHKMSKIAQILSITDAFDAATTEHSYKEAKRFSDIFAYMIKYSGRKFNPMYINIFLPQIAKKLEKDAIFPEDTYVILSTKEIACVTGYSITPYTLRPVVNIIINMDRQEKVLKYEIPVDLEKNLDRKIVDVIINEEMIKKLDGIRKKTKLRGAGVIIF